MLWFKHKHRAFVPIAPPIRQRFTTIRGRRVAVDIPYILPKDDEEIGRLDFQHYMLKLALHGNYAAPIRHPTAILDVATGSGRWAMEMAAQFPRAAVTGFDAIPPPADDTSGAYNPAARPANYVFRQGICLNGYRSLITPLISSICVWFMRPRLPTAGNHW